MFTLVFIAKRKSGKLLLYTQSHLISKIKRPLDKVQEEQKSCSDAFPWSIFQPRTHWPHHKGFTWGKMLWGRGAVGEIRDNCLPACMTLH